MNAFPQEQISNITKLKAILFDWDDTLAYTRKAVVETMEYVLRKYHKEPWDITKSKYRDTSKSLKENFPNFFGENSSAAYQDYLSYYTNFADRHVIQADYAKDFLNMSLLHHLDLFIISNKEKSLLLQEVKFCFPDIPFKSILGNGDASRNKPYPDLVFQALKHSSYPINPATVWLIGDTKQDTQCAYNAGVQPILIGNGKFLDQAYLDSCFCCNPPLLKFDNFKELCEFSFHSPCCY